MSAKVRVPKKAPASKVKKAKPLARKPAARKQAAREKGKTTITAKNQVTIPVAVLEAAGFKAGDRVKVVGDFAGQIHIFPADETPREVIDRLAGSFPGMYYPGYLDDVRSGQELRA